MCGDADDQRVVGESGVGQGVGDLQHVAVRGWREHRCDMSRGVSVTSTPVVRLEPLPIGVDQAHERNRHVEFGADLLGVAVEALLGLGVEDPERMQ